MTEPTYTPAAERTYASLAAYLRAADRRDGTWPLKRFLSVIFDQFGAVEDLARRVDYIEPGEPGSDARPMTPYSNLIQNPSFEHPSPLPASAGTNATGGRVEGIASWTDVVTGEWAWVWTATGAGQFGGQVNSSRMAVSGGPFAVGADVYAYPGRTIRFEAHSYNAANVSIGTVHADVTYAGGGGYERLEAVLVLPAAAASVDLAVYVLGGAGAGETFRVDCVLATPSSTPLPFVEFTGVAAGMISDLVNPDTANDRWLDWLGQLVGVKLNPQLTHQERVDAVKYASAGWRGGTKGAVADAARSALTGTKYVQVFDHSTEAGVGTGGEWDVLVVTRASETPDTSAVLAAIVAKNAKPAGVELHHLAYDATWAQIEAAYPTWADWAAAGSWQRIEEAGLP